VYSRNVLPSTGLWLRVLAVLQKSSNGLDWWRHLRIQLGLAEAKSIVVSAMQLTHAQHKHDMYSRQTPSSNMKSPQSKQQQDSFQEFLIPWLWPHISEETVSLPDSLACRPELGGCIPTWIHGNSNYATNFCPQVCKTSFPMHALSNSAHPIWVRSLDMNRSPLLPQPLGKRHVTNCHGVPKQRVEFLQCRSRPVAHPCAADPGISTF